MTAGFLCRDRRVKMAEYRRLISYIYEYEGKTKGRNVGFVKLEARNGMCRLNVNVKKIYMGGGDMGVYLLTGRQEIFLGNIFLRNGSGEFRAMVQVADVEQSGERMDECYGLTIHEKNDDWRTYTTIWEDAVAQAAQLTLESVTSDGLVEKQVEMGKVARVAPDAPEPPESPQEEPEKRPIEEPVGSPQEEPMRQPIEEPEWALSGEQKDSLQKKIPEDLTETPTQPLAGNQLRPWHETTWHLGTPKASLRVDKNPAGNAKKENAAEPVPDFEMGQLEMETRNPDVPLFPGGGRLAFGQKEDAEEKKAQPAKEPAAGKMESAEKPEEKLSGDGDKEEAAGARAPEKERPPVIHQYREEPIIIGDPEALAKLDAEEAEEPQIPIWDFLSESYPKIQAFDSEHGCQVLVIKPKDIGLLPRETWIYGNNSFLLHGYYNYRYLILARLENPKGRPRYILGVPGHYYSNEKYMASMFGFPHFVLSKKQSTKDGRFGYWYTDVRLEEERIPESLRSSAPDAAS